MVLQQLGGCPVYDFKPRITFGNDQLLPAGMYGVRLPSGLASTQAPAPQFIDPTTMVLPRTAAACPNKSLATPSATTSFWVCAHTSFCSVNT